MSSEKASIPYRQIRAQYDAKTITVYQAYSSSIAIPAVEFQKLDASPNFSASRMTWIKPSWSWMMYRSGYSYKDDRQAHILAIKLTHEGFLELLRRATLTTEVQSEQTGKKVQRKERGESVKSVRVQWDPERTHNLGRLEYRSIQIGIAGEVTKKEWIDKWIVEIEDVTERARALKKALDEKSDLTKDELLDLGLIPEEREFEVPEEI
ncbi:hypothetical protein M501DRAFT_963742, partial [Patellaria atrata CBS 101060]